jgi:hypothetical protein
VGFVEDRSAVRGVEGDEGRSAVVQRLGHEREGTACPVRVDGVVEVALSI